MNAFASAGRPRSTRRYGFSWDRRVVLLASLLLTSAAACADRAPPARFPDAEPPAMAKPIDDQGERGTGPANDSEDAPSGEAEASAAAPYAEPSDASAAPEAAAPEAAEGGASPDAGE
jgi:hypothetical protein